MKKHFCYIPVFLLFIFYGISDQGDDKTPSDFCISQMDVTENWTYPYKCSEEKYIKIEETMRKCKLPVKLNDLINRLGMPDRIDDLSKDNKPLSHREMGFIDSHKGKFSYRCIWFVRKESIAACLGDSWLAAYVAIDRTTVTVLHENWLKK